MFGDVVEPSIKVGTKVVHSASVDHRAHGPHRRAVVIPLMATDILPTPPDMMGTFVAAPRRRRRRRHPLPPPPPQASCRRRRRRRRSDHHAAAAPRGAAKKSSLETGSSKRENVGGRRRRRRRRWRVTGGIVGGLGDAPPRRPRRRRRPHRAGRVGGQDQAADQDQGRQAGLSAHRAVGPRAGRRHHRSDDRPERQGAGSESAPLDSAARSRALDAVKRWQCHADAAQWRARCPSS